MAKSTNIKNTVRFTFLHTSDQNEMCTGMKRGRWQSSESLKRLNKGPDTLDLPPRRPSRDSDFLTNISNDLFVFDLAESDEEDGPPAKPQDRNMPRSILKRTSKYSPVPPPGLVKSKKYKRSSRTRFDTRTDYSDSSESSYSETSEEKPTTVLSNKHKDSILDLPQLAYRCKPKLNHDGLLNPISLPSLVCIGDEDEIDQSQRSNESSSSIGLEI
eukprot:CAMPEP_0116099450 /NCGR_PEP_ID=MMETSP0327-20121206/11768_1 /TAXON_ID=44447 /ORGANISM="Pseudo-nitzschia delicatissima, Strain B596" /LENGTH=214 /DNA_ID=CAMNT_0003591315 /DNA_START=97 /DNA_END=741 /DNA_ORIENTATION=+